ncbi:DUF4197 domain-containing protein [Nitrogeniibacter mangrovi]|uniref:DUF4197 domain-containing protein n=1 Tax=Nitrogeniibacter mangrovi TaxID=2016596 RepID=A0A6C1B0G3_9RHOO|nr:DUF4197 domain-containing protein [Nitrogeniibacter mangrovi]QID16385.1 DUF4197 domain-containing protein [Nitrogeniibacter mangrovi]
MRAIVRALCVFLISAPAFAGALDLLSNAQATGGLKEALQQGAEAAVSQLGTKGGFLNNAKVRIPLPNALEKTRPLLKMMGKSDELDELQTAMNRAAEAAVPEAKDLLVSAVKQMSVDDAKKILTGGDNSVTQYFESKTRAALTERFLPVVSKQTDRLSLANQYNKVAGKVAKAGLLKGDETSVETFVTAKALDGLYATIAEQEREIRANPMQAAGSLAKKVFEAIK